jgi:hypothetical protein
MKAPKPELQNNRILRLAKRFISLPVVLVLAIGAGIKSMWTRGKSDERVRAGDKLRQSRARRTLRGLPPDHVQSARPAATTGRADRSNAVAD